MVGAFCDLRPDDAIAAHDEPVQIVGARQMSLEVRFRDQHGQRRTARVQRDVGLGEIAEQKIVRPELRLVAVAALDVVLATTMPVILLTVFVAGVKPVKLVVPL